MGSATLLALLSAPLLPAQGISPSRAARAATQELVATPRGAELRRPRSNVAFTATGIEVRPRRGPVWRWSLAGADEVRPTIADEDLVTFERGALREEYRISHVAVEQCFVLEEPLVLDGQDLVIEGIVESPGAFSARSGRWVWEDTEGAVTLGDVFVHDATGAALPAWMSVTAGSTRIVVDGAALAAACYPVVVDPEIGTNDFRISDMGPDGPSGFTAQAPVVAYNPAHDEYLVAWLGDDVTDDVFAIYVQRIDASNGAEIGQNDVRISAFGLASSPAVAYDSTNDQYLVVWQDSTTGGLEIFGQLLDAVGNEIGPDDFQISDVGPPGASLFSAAQPDMVYNSVDDRYLVVWFGDDDVGPLVQDETEVFGQLLDATGQQIGADDFRISDMGPDGNTAFGVLWPEVVHNPTLNEYLVVWQGDDGSGALVDDESEIYGQRLGGNGLEVGANDFRISDMGPDGDTAFSAHMADVAYYASADRYLVVWAGRDEDAPLHEKEIYGQLLDASGAEVGPNDFRISDMGPPADPSFTAITPRAAEAPGPVDGFLVVWAGNDDATGVDEIEIYGQQLDANGAPVGPDDFRLSDMGPAGDTFFNVGIPGLVAGPGPEHLVVFMAKELLPTGPENFEIYGQLYSGCPATSPGSFSPSGTRTCALPIVANNPLGSLIPLSGPPVIGSIVRLGIHNPEFTQPTGAPTILTVSTKEPAFPTFLPGYGMCAAGSAGELLVDLTPPNPVFTIAGPIWPAPTLPDPGPAVVSFPIPFDCNLVGQEFVAQGLILATGHFGLTEQLRIVVGS